MQNASACQYVLGHMICANNPALDDQNQYEEHLHVYAEYIHVSMYLVICANYPALED